jgi:hypothetical protein
MHRCVTTRPSSLVQTLRSAGTLATLLTASGCESGGTTTLTWNDDIGPMMQASCGSCHHEGGSGQFDLLSYEQAVKFSESALTAMETGRMPPWPPAANCREYVGERSLPDGGLERFREWVRGGKPAGVGEPIAFTPPETVGLRADLEASMNEPYTPDDTITDDYRCFLLDLDFAADTWIEGVDVTPGTSQVHHVLMYAVGGQALANAEQADAEESGPGYTCFGGPVPSAGGGGGLGQGSGAAMGGMPTQIGAWVPGMNARQLPADSAMRVPAGSRIVMQVHYNTIGGPVVADSTKVVMQARSDAPASLYRTVPVAQPNLSIAAGDPASKHAITIRNWSANTAEVAAAAHHMHTLGDSIRAYITRASGVSECLLDIPEWDFQWQLQYQLAPGTHAFVEPGDEVTLECVYDNSAANQPTVDGVKQEPREVTWGEGTFDEMCLMYLGVLAPWTGEPPPTTAPCANAKACFDACPTKDTTCLLNCEGASTACLSCAAQGFIGCGALSCAQSLQAASSCVLPCAMSINAFGGSLGTCMQGSCPEAWENVTTCLDPFVSDADCGEVLPGCGL